MGRYNPNLSKTIPPDEASRKFQREGTAPMKSATDSFLVKDNGIFTAHKNIKIFDRKSNHYGNDQDQSIKQYDESEVVESLYDEKKKNAHRKLKKRHIFVNGQWKAVATQAHSNKEARKDAKGAGGKVEIVKEIGVTEDLKQWFADKKKKIRNQDNSQEVDNGVSGDGGAVGENIKARELLEILTKSGQEYERKHPQRKLEGDPEEEEAKKKFEARLKPQRSKVKEAQIEFVKSIILDEESKFNKLKNKIKSKEGYSDKGAAGAAYEAGVKAHGKAYMTRKAAAGKKKVTEGDDVEAMIAAFKAKGGKVKKIETGKSNNFSSKEWRTSMQDNGEKLTNREEQDARKAEHEGLRKLEKGREAAYLRQTQGIKENWKYKTYPSDEAAKKARKTHFSSDKNGNACRYLGNGKLAYKGELGTTPIKKDLNETSSTLLTKYIHRAATNGLNAAYRAGQNAEKLRDTNPNDKSVNKLKKDFSTDAKKAENRRVGLKRAANKLMSRSITETLGPKAKVSDWIDDFVHSNDSRFEGKSKEERIKMALGAYYANHKEVKEVLDPLTAGSVIVGAAGIGGAYAAKHIGDWLNKRKAAKAKKKEELK